MTPLPEKKKRMDIKALNKKKLASIFKTLVALKQLVKTLRKEKGSQKKPRGK